MKRTVKTRSYFLGMFINFCLYITLLFCFTLGKLSASTLILEGKYQSKNIFVINQISEEGVGFNVYEIRINGLITTDEVNNYAFEIDLAQFHFSKGEIVTIEIKYKNLVPPKILNPYALTPIPTFEVSKIYIDNQNILRWETSEEDEELQFIIQQFKWNKWISVGKVTGKGGRGKNNYAFKPLLVSGINKLRVAQIGHNEVLRASMEATKHIESTNIDCDIKTKEKKVIFSGKTCFEIYDQYGSLRKRGYGHSVDISNLGKGKYHINYDNRTRIFAVDP